MRISHNQLDSNMRELREDVVHAVQSEDLQVLLRTLRKVNATEQDVSNGATETVTEALKEMKRLLYEAMNRYNDVRAHFMLRPLDYAIENARIYYDSATSLAMMLEIETIEERFGRLSEITNKHQKLAIKRVKGGTSFEEVISKYRRELQEIKGLYERLKRELVEREEHLVKEAERIRQEEEERRTALREEYAPKAAELRDKYQQCMKNRAFVEAQNILDQLQSYEMRLGLEETFGSKTNADEFLSKAKAGLEFQIDMLERRRQQLMRMRPI